MNEAAIEAVRSFLRSLSSAMQVYDLYVKGHPNRRDAQEQLRRAAAELASATEEPLFITRSSLYLGSRLLARESLSMGRVTSALEARDVDAIELEASVTVDDVNSLVLVLRGELPLRDRYGGVVLNRIHPTTEVSREEMEGQLTSLRRAYSRGLDTLRDQARRIAAGQALDLGAASGVVDNLAGEVAADPGHALLLTTVKSHDEPTYYHMVNVCLLTIAMAQALGLRHDQVTSLGLGALLHDVGKVHMPHEVLNHVGKLSPEMWRVVQKHPVDGAGLIFATTEGLYHPAASTILEHHAAYNLAGYPGLSRRQSPSPMARLVSVADAFDAITTKRAYRAAVSRRDALEIIEAGSGRGFDPRVVRVFVTLLGLFPVGSLVELDTGEVAIVQANHESMLGRPSIMVALDASGNVADLEPRDLSERDAEGRFRWVVRRTLDPADVGIDVMAALTMGEVVLAPPDRPGGLVHEPGISERRPEGYVDTHAEAQAAAAGLHGHAHGPGGEHLHAHAHDGAGGRAHPDGQGDLAEDPDVHPPLTDDDLTP